MSKSTTPPERYMLHQDPDGTIWAASDDGAEWVQLPGHVARIIHERDLWYDTATAHLRAIGDTAKERDTWERYARRLEDTLRATDEVMEAHGIENDLPVTIDDVIEQERYEAGITEEMLA